jgi:N4-gp56 family major capsid protein
MSSVTGGAGAIAIFYDKKFLERAKLMLRYDVGAQKKDVAPNNGKTVYFTRFSPLAISTTGITDEVSATAVDMTGTTVSATALTHAYYTKVSALYNLTSIDVGLAEHIDVHGTAAGEIFDTIIAEELDGGGTSQVVNNAAVSAVATSDIIDGSEIRKSVRTLKVNKAMKFEDGYMKAIIPVSVVADLRGDSEWLDAYRYTNATNIQNGEAGTLHGVRFFETNNEVIAADAGAGNVDNYETFIFGKEAYGVLDIGGKMAPKVSVKTPGPNSTDNPADLFSTVGFSFYTAAKVLNSSWLIELTSASSFGTN